MADLGGFDGQSGGDSSEVCALENTSRTFSARMKIPLLKAVSMFLILLIGIYLTLEIKLSKRKTYE